MSPRSTLCRHRSALVNSTSNSNTCTYKNKNRLQQMIWDQQYHQTAMKFQQMNVYFLAQLGTMQTDQNKKLHSSKINVQMSHWCFWHKKGEQKHILYTNHMYLLSVVSNVNGKRKTPIMIFFIHKTKKIFNNTAHDHNVFACHQQGLWLHPCQHSVSYYNECNNPLI